MPSTFPLRVLVVHAWQDTERQLADIIRSKKGHQAIEARLSSDMPPMGTRWRNRLAQKVNEHRCHIVLMDETLLGDSLGAKSKAIPHLGNAIRPAHCVLYVGTTIAAERAMDAFIADMLLAPVTDSIRGSLVLEPASDHVVQRKRAKSHRITDSTGQLSRAADKIAVELDEILELLAYLFPTAKRIQIEPFPFNATTRTVARGRSALLAVTVDGKVADVLKLGPSEKIRIEAENYYGFVDGRLIGLRYASLRQHKELWNVGGLVYSLLGVGEELPLSFSQYYAKHSVWPENVVRDLLEGLFHSWSQHYRQGLKDTSDSLFEQYDIVWSKRLNAKLTALSMAKPDIPSNFRFLPHPVDWVVEHKPKSATRLMQKAITHGDFHGDNFLVDREGHCWLLDFERTGWGPILQDYVELEVDTLTRLVDFSEGQDAFFKFCVALVAPDIPEKEEDYRKQHELSLREHINRVLPLPPSLLHASVFVIHLRRLAAKHTRYVDCREYLWGMLLNTIYIASLEPELERLHRALILGGVICERLNNWENYQSPPRWPPPEWKAMLPELPSTPASYIYRESSLPVLQLQLTELRNKKGEFEVSVIGDPNRQPRTDSTLPYDANQLVAVMKILEFGQYKEDAFSPEQVAALWKLKLLDDAALAADWMARIGGQLYESLVPPKGGVRTAFENVLATRGGGRLQLVFDKSATDLACYPWELLHDGYPADPQSPIDVIRTIAISKEADQFTIPRDKHPCRVLYVWSRPNGLQKAAADHDAVKNSVAGSNSSGQFEFEDLTKYTYATTHQALKARLNDHARPVHILHFDGHGMFARRCPHCREWNQPHSLVCHNSKCKKPLSETPAKGYLAFETENKDVDWIDTTTMLAGIPRSDIKLVVLSSCQSARVRGANLLLAGVGPGLILGGVPAVVAMQFSVYDDDSILFNQHFYQAIAQGYSLPDAVYQGRTMLTGSAHYAPVLYLRSHDGEMYLCAR